MGGAGQLKDVIYPHAYVALLAVSFLDVAFTWIILSLGGQEINPVMRIVLLAHGLPGMVLFKFAVVLLVVVLCEEVGRRHFIKGRRLIRTAVGISMLPVFAAIVQLVLYRVTFLL